MARYAENPREVVAGSIRNCLEAYQTFRRKTALLAEWVAYAVKAEAPDPAGVEEYMLDSFHVYGAYPTNDQIEDMVQDILENYAPEEGQEDA